MKGPRYGAVFITVVLSFVGTLAFATSHSNGTPDRTLSTGLVIPPMDATNGRLLFISKACVVCHSVNSVDGRNAPQLDARFVDQPMNPFAFAARMWRGVESMVLMQRNELGDMIQLSGQELAEMLGVPHD